MKKFPRKVMPEGHTISDFKCFGPPATKDGEFEGTKLCDMGCFKQENVDSNKYVHAAIVQSTINNKFYFYAEFGRVGAPSADFQFFECNSESEAHKKYCDYLHSKNDKRGIWISHPKLGPILTPKKGKDLYLVRPQLARSTGLPDAKTICTNVIPHNKTKTKTSKKFDTETLQLLNDLNFGTLSYTRNSMVDQALPAPAAIQEARDICDAATTIINKDKDPLHNEELIQLSYLIYSRIPKRKSKKETSENWILTAENISKWQSDLDAFEVASFNINVKEHNPLEDMDIELVYLNPNSDLGKFLYKWIPACTRNKHSYIRGQIKIKNVWYVKIPKRWYPFKSYQEKVAAEISDDAKSVAAKALHQPSRQDLEKKHHARFRNSNTLILFHGTRSVNVAGILREGLRLPKNLSNVQTTGAMFGQGLYTADDYKKSIGYTSYRNSYWSRGSGNISNRSPFMFICDVVLGNPYLVRNNRQLPAGYHSIFAEARYANVQNNEYVVFDEVGTYIRYLVEFDI